MTGDMMRELSEKTAMTGDTCEQSDVGGTSRVSVHGVGIDGPCRVGYKHPPPTPHLLSDPPASHIASPTHSPALSHFSFLPAPGLGNEGYDGAAWAAEEFNEAAKEGTLETEGTTERTDGGVHVCERG